MVHIINPSAALSLSNKEFLNKEAENRSAAAVKEVRSMQTTITGYANKPKESRSISR